MLRLACVCALCIATYGVASAGDAALGKTKADTVCAECHEKADWADQDAASLEAMIKNVVAGKTKHQKKLQLTDEEIAGIAAYWAGK
jgi:mono/diheme cytochrome c family protein